MPPKDPRLETYRSKRDFRKTPEPSGRRGGPKLRGDDNPIFVIQQHDARTLHFDFRLEVDGALESWAIPKGPSTDPRQKRLAVRTEEHPLEYADFEGVIPEDEYGGGTVIVWDAGPYRSLNTDDEGGEISMRQALDRGLVEVWLEGKKLRGGFVLVHSKLRGNEANWLLVKKRDEGADARRNPTKTEPESVLSGRTIEQIAREEEQEDG